LCVRVPFEPACKLHTDSTDVASSEVDNTPCPSLLRVILLNFLLLLLLPLLILLLLLTQGGAG
jgi:hypothetical protein